MQHQEVIQLIKDFRNGQKAFILPSTSIHDYKSFEDWEIGVNRSHEMAEILSSLGGSVKTIQIGTYETSNFKDLTSEEESARLEFCFEKYPIQRITVEGSDVVFYPRHK